MRAELSNARLQADAFLLAVAVRLGMRLLGVRRLARAMAHLRSHRRPEAGTIERCVAAASSAAARAAHPTCLFKALVAFGLLSTRGHAVTVHIGASLDGEFSAHAWLSVDGRVLEPAQLGEYAVLWRYGAGAAQGG